MTALPRQSEWDEALRLYDAERQQNIRLREIIRGMHRGDHKGQCSHACAVACAALLAEVTR
jgi:hypothetical protein